MIELRGISKSYGDIKALDSLSIELARGEVIGLVGPNGSGKSTLLRIMLGLLRPDEGSVLLDGKELGAAEWKELRRRLGYMPERVSFYDNLTGRETLKLFAKVKGCAIGRVEEVAGGIIPAGALDRKVGGYSKGMRQRLNLAQALLNDPDLLVLDEPTSGLDPEGIMEFYRIIKEARSRKEITVILSSHVLAEIESRTSRIAIIKDGKLKALGRLEDLYAELDLPLNIRLTLEKEDIALEKHLKEAGAEAIQYRNGYMLVSVSRENKLKVLSAVMSRQETIKDLSIREPSLEEVFFGIH